MAPKPKFHTGRKDAMLTYLRMLWDMIKRNKPISAYKDPEERKIEWDQKNLWKSIDNSVSSFYINFFQIYSK